MNMPPEHFERAMSHSAQTRGPEHRRPLRDDRSYLSPEARAAAEAVEAGKAAREVLEGWKADYHALKQKIQTELLSILDESVNLASTRYEEARAELMRALNELSLLADRIADRHLKTDAAHFQVKIERHVLQRLDPSRRVRREIEERRPARVKKAVTGALPGSEAPDADELERTQVDLGRAHTVKVDLEPEDAGALSVQAHLKARDALARELAAEDEPDRPKMLWETPAPLSRHENLALHFKAELDRIARLAEQVGGVTTGPLPILISSLEGLRRSMAKGDRQRVSDAIFRIEQQLEFVRDRIAEEREITPTNPALPRGRQSSLPSPLYAEEQLVAAVEALLRELKSRVPAPQEVPGHEPDQGRGKRAAA